MKFVYISIVDADTAAEAEQKAADKSVAWVKTGQIEGDATPERVTDTINAIALRYKQEKK